jgi:peptide/nickel transport system ATP-binding protein
MESPSSEGNVVVVKELKKYFPLRRGVFASVLSREQLYVRAIDGISFDLGRAEILVLAGESGCGKTTTGLVTLGLEAPTEGRVIFDGTDIGSLTRAQLKPYRRRMQIIFQDPYESLNPRQSIYEAIAEPLGIHKIPKTDEEEYQIVREALETVDLTPPDDFMIRFPHELSGGQRQRVAIARALVLKPEFIVADEPVSMLDVSTRSEILNLMLDLRRKFRISYLFITHDLAVASYVGDRIGIMYLGKIVELGPSEMVTADPKHPYTQALMSAVPSPDPTKHRERIILKGEPPSPVNPPLGCRFHPRCPYVMDVCKRDEPQLVMVQEGHYVACHLYD